MTAADDAAVASYAMASQAEAQAIAEYSEDFWTDLILITDVIGSWETWAQAVQPQLMISQYRAAVFASVYHDHWQWSKQLVDSGQRLDPRLLAGFDQRTGNAAIWPTYSAVIEVLKKIGKGMDPAEAIRQGKAHASSIVARQVHDAADESFLTEGMLRRGGDAYEGRGNRLGTGWVWITIPPSCARCVVLNGRDNYLHKPRERHHNCDCTVAPKLEDGTPVESLFTHEALYEAMTPEQRVNAFGLERTRQIEAGKLTVYDAAKDRQRPRDTQRALPGAKTVRAARLGAKNADDIDGLNEGLSEVRRG